MESLLDILCPLCYSKGTESKLSILEVLMLKKLMSCIREYKKPSILSSVFIALEVIIECFIPFITAQLIDFLTQKNESGLAMGTSDLKTIAVYGGALLVMALLSLSRQVWISLI